MAGKRRSIHVEGVQHGAPIPMGAKVGNMLFSSGISASTQPPAMYRRAWRSSASSPFPT